MRFPARLSAKLAKARVAGFFRGARPAHLIDFVDAAEVLHAGSAHPISHERIRSLLVSPAPILWIGGSEPLEHPGIAHLVRAIVQGGRFVFLETCGALLRRRIHEFQPVLQLFLAIRSAGPPPSAPLGSLVSSLPSTRPFAKIPTFPGSRLSPEFFPPRMSMAG
jgi:hypothetical protein